MDYLEDYRNMVPDATKQMLTVLIQKKAEKEKWKSLLNQWGFSFMFILVLFWVYASFTIADLTGQEGAGRLLSDPVVWICGLFCMLSGFQLMRLRKKHGKADDEYESARRDFIDRNEEWWSEREQWDNRHLVLEFMKNEYNINVINK
ncbi:DUF2663 family protein [Fictibacillus iocasae]|uniref:DUF2663 family protein n=1 Tax=Fictibacillus iocasae TaxID=2715437 RepID=A0ABW2NII0_9BACL